jgi:hypothetical protein
VEVASIEAHTTADPEILKMKFVLRNVGVILPDYTALRPSRLVLFFVEFVGTTVKTGQNVQSSRFTYFAYEALTAMSMRNSEFGCDSYRNSVPVANIKKSLSRRAS